MTVVRDNCEVRVSKTVTKRKATRRQMKPKAVWVENVKIDPRVLATAKRLARFDETRLRLNADGSVTVLNKPRVVRE